MRLPAHRIVAGASAMIPFGRGNDERHRSDWWQGQSPSMDTDPVHVVNPFLRSWLWKKRQPCPRGVGSRCIRSSGKQEMEGEAGPMEVS